MADASPPRPSGRSSRLALVFAAAAVAACWNPFAAPFGLVVGAIAIVLAMRARRSPGRRVAMMALGLSVLATVASVVVLVATAGVASIELPGEPVVKGRSQAEVEEILSRSAEQTRARRERALGELDALDGTTDGAARPAGKEPGKAGVAPRDGGRR